jgi:hypothetical protein
MWENGKHDLVHMGSEDNYIGCKFEHLGTTMLADRNATQYVFPCTNLGKHLLSSSVEGDCNRRNLKIQIQVVNTHSTTILRGTHNYDTQQKHYSY